MNDCSPYFLYYVQEAGGALFPEEEGSADGGPEGSQTPWAQPHNLSAQQDGDLKKWWLPECLNRPKPFLRYCLVIDMHAPSSQPGRILSPWGKRRRGLFKTSAASLSLPVKPEDVAEAEVNSYLMTPAIDGEDDPLAWWRVYEISYTQLSTMARKYLCVPATSAPSERLFSTGGNIVTCTRSSLKPAKVIMLVFLAKNLWATEKKNSWIIMAGSAILIVKFSLWGVLLLCISDKWGWSIL